MKKYLFILIFTHCTILIYTQKDYRKKYFNEIKKSTVEFFPIAEKEYLSFDNYECNSLTINHYKDLKIENSYTYPDEHIYHYTYKRRGEIFLMIAYISAHDVNAYQGPHFINSKNYHIIPEFKINSHEYSDFTFLSDSTILAIAFHDFNTNKKVDEWHILDLNGNLIGKIGVPFNNFSKVLKLQNYLIVANDFKTLVLSNDYVKLKEFLFQEVKNIYSIGVNHIAIHTKNNDLSIVSLSTMEILATYVAKNIESNNEDFIEVIDVNDKISKLEIINDSIFKTEILNAGDKHYKPIKFTNDGQGYITYGDDSYNYGVAEYRYFNQEIENDNLVDVAVTHSIESLNNIVVTIETPSGPHSSDFTELEGTYTLKNHSDDTVGISAITSGYGGAFCFTFEDVHYQKLLPFEEKTFLLSKNIYGKKTDLNFCLFAVSVNGRTDFDHKDNKSCSYTIATKTDDTELFDLAIYPNPTSDILNIKSDIEIESVKLYDRSGRLIKDCTKYEIDLTNVSNGVYQLILESKSGIRRIKKVIKVE